MPCWIDTHCHLDAPEFAADLPAVRQQARALGVRCCVIAAVSASTFDEARQAAHRLGDAYALGTHPLYVPQAGEGAAQQLAAALQAHAGDARLVAVGEIGLDFFAPALAAPPWRERQQALFRQQLKLARRHGLPVILHSRHAVDAVLRGYLARDQRNPGIHQTRRGHGHARGRIDMVSTPKIF